MNFYHCCTNVKNRLKGSKRKGQRPHSAPYVPGGSERDSATIMMSLVQPMGKVQQAAARWSSFYWAGLRVFLFFNRKPGGRQKKSSVKPCLLAALVSLYLSPSRLRLRP